MLRDLGRIARMMPTIYTLLADGFSTCETVAQPEVFGVTSVPFTKFANTRFSFRFAWVFNFHASFVVS
jgi:hypothetical protein